MKGAANWFVASEAECDVGDSTTDLGARADSLDLPSGTDKVHSIVVVLRQPSTNGEDVGVKDNVLGVISDLVDKELVSSAADSNLQ